MATVVVVVAVGRRGRGIGSPAACLITKGDGKGRSCQIPGFGKVEIIHSPGHRFIDTPYSWVGK